MSLSIDPQVLSDWHAKVMGTVEKLPCVVAAYDGYQAKPVSPDLYMQGELYFEITAPNGDVRRLDLVQQDQDNKLKYQYIDSPITGKRPIFLFPNTTCGPSEVYQRLKRATTLSINKIFIDVLFYNLETIATNAFSKTSDREFYLLSQSTGDEQCDKELHRFLPANFEATFSEQTKDPINALYKGIKNIPVANIPFRRRLVAAVMPSDIDKLEPKDMALLTSAQQVSLITNPVLLDALPPALVGDVHPKMTHLLDPKQWTHLKTGEQVANLLQSSLPVHLLDTHLTMPLFQLINDIKSLTAALQINQQFYKQLTLRQVEMIVEEALRLEGTPNYSTIAPILNKLPDNKLIMVPTKALRLLSDELFKAVHISQHLGILKSPALINRYNQANNSNFSLKYKDLPYIDVKEFKHLSPKQKVLYAVITIAWGVLSALGSILMAPAFFSKKVRDWSLAPAKRLCVAAKYAVRR